MAPRPIDKEAQYKEYASKNNACQSEISRFIYLEGIDRINNISTPCKSDNCKYKQKNGTYSVGNGEWHLNLPADDSFFWGSLIYPEYQVLENAHLAAPRTNEFIGNKDDHQKDCEGYHAGWKDSAG